MQIQLIKLPDKTYLANKRIFLDNGYLSFISTNKTALGECIEYLCGYRLVDQFVRIEFLRDSTDPELNKYKEELLNPDVGLFSPVEYNQEQFLQLVKDKIIWISKIYSYHRNGKKHTANPNFIDLNLAALAATYENSVVVTPNGKDFPAMIFDNIGALSYVNERGEFENFTVLQINKDRLIEAIINYVNFIKKKEELLTKSKNRPGESGKGDQISRPEFSSLKES